MDNTLLDISKERLFWQDALESQYETGEADILFFLSLEEILGINKLKALLESKIETKNSLKKALDSILNRLIEGEPIQYILGFTDFFGRKYQVGPDVLIPRPETEELVEWVLEDLLEFHKNSPQIIPNILDIGTGSGCIPITLGLEFRESNIWGLDVSDKALEMALKNNILLGSNVKFMKGDILDIHNKGRSGFQVFYNPDRLKIEEEPIPSKWDYIISNPPYIPISDRNSLSIRVKGHEPSLALFVPDQNPLLFYEMIFHFAQRVLNVDGKIFFEIHEPYSLQMKDLGIRFGFRNYQLRKDLMGKARMVRFQKG